MLQVPPQRRARCERVFPLFNLSFPFLVGLLGPVGWLNGAPQQGLWETNREREREREFVWPMDGWHVAIKTGWSLVLFKLNH